MESACVAVVFCVLSCCFGLVQSRTYCTELMEAIPWFIIRYVNVCQDDIGSLWRGRGYGTDWLVLDVAAAPLQQDIACSCYLSFTVHRQQYMKVMLLIIVDGQQKASFALDDTVLYDNDNWSHIDITTNHKITYQQNKQDHPTRICMVIAQNPLDRRGRLTLRCQQPVVSTTDITLTTTSTTDTMTTLTSIRPVQTSDSSVPEKTSAQPIPEMTSSLSDQTEKEDATKTWTEKTRTHSMIQNTPTNLMPEKNTSHSMSENITTQSMAEKTITHSMSEKNTAHSMPEDTTLYSILEKTTAFSMLAKTATRSIQEKYETRSMPEASSTHTSHPSHPEEEEPTNDIPGIVAGAAAGVVILLAWIVITILLVWRRKYSVRNADNPVNLHALVAGGHHAAAGDTDPQPAHDTIHTETSETGSIHMYEEMELYPISPEVLPVSIDAQHVYSDSNQPGACNNDDIVDDYEQVSNDESDNQYLDLSSVIEDDNTDCQMTRAQIHKGIAEIGIKITNNDELEVTLIPREAPAAAIDKPPCSDTTQSAENMELESTEGSDYEDCTIVTTQHESIQGVDIQPTHSTTGIIDVHTTKHVRPFELSLEVPEASIDKQFLYDDTGLPLRDMASRLRTNGDYGDTYEQLSEEQTSREHQYIDLESPERSDYEDCEIVTRQQSVTREQLPLTCATTGIDARQTRYDELDLTAMSRELPETPIDAHYLYSDTDSSTRDMASADYINNHGNGNEQTSEIEIDHQYLEIRSSTGSDYADCEIIHDI